MTSDKDILDLTALQKRGLIRKQPAQALPQRNEAGILDFSAQNQQPSQNSQEENAFNFLSNLSNAENTNSPQQTDDSEISSLKIKIDDLEYKLDRFIDKLTEIESKINL